MEYLINTPLRGTLAQCSSQLDQVLRFFNSGIESQILLCWFNFLYIQYVYIWWVSFHITISWCQCIQVLFNHSHITGIDAIYLITPAYVLSFLYVHIDIALSTGFLLFACHNLIRSYVCTHKYVCMHICTLYIHCFTCLDSYMYICMHVWYIFILVWAHIYGHTCVILYTYVAKIQRLVVDKKTHKLH